jgi:hypothetical protein
MKQEMPRQPLVILGLDFVTAGSRYLLESIRVAWELEP